MSKTPKPDRLSPKMGASFERDLKRARKRGNDLSRLYAIIDTLARRDALESRLRDHALKGNWRDWRECHIGPDWLLIYQIDGKAGELILGRTGTHADLLE